MNLRVTLLASCLVILSLTVFERSKFGDVLENEIAVGASYQLRSWLDKDPKISDRLKVFFFDDKAFAAVGRPDLNISEWVDVFASLDERKPKAILVDKLFSFPEGDLGKMIHAKLKNQTAIYTASFSTMTKIPGRSEIKNTAASGYNDHSFREVSFSVKGKTPYIYGANRKIRGFLSGTGHVEYRSQSHIPAFIKAGEKRILPHISSKVADSYEVENGVIIPNGVKVNTDSRGRILVNHGTKEALTKQSYGMAPLYIRATRSKKPISVVNEGDIVLLLPGMFTGGSDWHRTLLGTMPGGTIIAALVNSVLTGEHLHKWTHGRPFFIVLSAAIGVGLGLFAGGGLFWIVFALTLLLVPVSGMFAFTYLSIAFPWFYPLIGFGVSSLLAMGQKTSALRTQKIRMESELETAHAVQKHFIKDGEFIGRNFISYGLFLGASECSGDWLFKISNQHSDYLFLGDVMGHGVSAALVTSLASSIVRAEIEREGVTLEHMATVINKVMYETFAGKISMSLTAFSFCHGVEEVEILNAGHTFPIIIENGKAKTIRVTGSLLGVAADSSFKVKKVPFHPGQRLFTYTDGLVESQSEKIPNIRTKKLFGLIEKCSKLPLQQMNLELYEETSQVLGRRQAPDDITLLCVDLGVRKVAEPETTKAA